MEAKTETESKSEFTCLRCGYSTNYKSAMKRHLTKKKPCSPKIRDISIEDTLKQVLDEELNDYKIAEITRLINKHNDFDCLFCGKKFTLKSNTKRHMKDSCSHNPLKNELSNVDISKTKSGISITNNIYKVGTNDEIESHLYGKISHLSDKIKKLRFDNDFVDDFKNMLINKLNIPENITLNLDEVINAYLLNIISDLNVFLKEIINDDDEKIIKSIIKLHNYVQSYYNNDTIMPENVINERQITTLSTNNNINYEEVKTILYESEQQIIDKVNELIDKILYIQNF